MFISERFMILMYALTAMNKFIDNYSVTTDYNAITKPEIGNIPHNHIYISLHYKRGILQFRNDTVQRNKSDKTSLI